MDERQKVIIQSTAALDQYWESLEIMYPYVCELGNEIPARMNKDAKEVARLCCQLVSWELALRALKKNRTVKCEVKYSEGGTSIIELLSESGFKTFVVPDESIIKDEQGTRLKVTSYKAPDGYHKVYIPNAEKLAKGDSVIVPETEIEQELPND
jgi:hypothetical protein